ncbi:helix-turn-helix domain-containing protein [Deminuibacter soli]|uniref:AraC family transcriptional regulator n=1 Tax=Deminuibacter soli TaxID=2291815 RepID=A0A3E1NEQ9_9BACT|nr:helix-turn-helix domain-containing protein [Deminuibacter soli]RFM26258.1 AraC family transcriptional regulator [Deminuibacter soli]
MENKLIQISSINQLHRYYDCGKPQHPLVSVIDLSTIRHNLFAENVSLRMSLYIISCKRFTGKLHYGRQQYDFEEGSLLFTAPGQVISSDPEVQLEEGWALFFHPDLINATTLGQTIHRYSFFLYDTSEALHVSDEEKQLLQDCVNKIKREYTQNIDKHTQGLVVSNIELLLNYCNRFYDRQFLTRAKSGNDIVQRFERLLHACFAQDTLIATGLPDVKYFASQLNISPKYLSDLLSRYTGKTTQEHLHLQLTEKAKSLLWGTNQSISEIAYGLGFEHPSHFTKMFKTKTGLSPREYRNGNRTN